MIGAMTSAVLSTRPYRAEYKGAVVGLLPVVAARYPGGLAWLDRRLDDARDGAARCRLAWLDNRLVGATIETPKGRGRVKLSTVWVDPGARGRGVGRLLLEDAIRGWQRRGVVEAWLTVALAHCDGLLAAAEPRGFEIIGMAADRYWEGETELVLGWNLERAPHDLS